MIIHTVKPGDTVYKIAKMYNTTPTKILEDNALPNPDRLVVGQTIVILFPTQTYTVRRGDTLTSIANATGANIRTLYQNNPALGGEATLYPGQILTIAYPEPEYGTLSVNGYAYPGIRTDILRTTLPYLTYLTVFAGRVTADGGIIPPNDEVLTAEARKYGVSPILLIANLSERGGFDSDAVGNLLADPAARMRFSRNLAGALRDRGYAGVEFDFEYVPAEYAETYANLIENTRQMLCREGFCVFVAAAPKISGDQRGLLYEGHDYGEFGAAANGVRLMTYEWGYTYGPPMPVAPLPQVRRVVEYALTEIPAEKITMGIPSYGYDWALPYVSGETRARSLGSVAAVTLAGNERVAIEYDDETQSPQFTYYDTDAVPPVQHIVHFEDANSIKAKLALVHELGLSGAGLWNIMQYFPQFWLVLHQLYRTVEPFPCSCD